LAVKRTDGVMRDDPPQPLPSDPPPAAALGGLAGLSIGDSSRFAGARTSCIGADPGNEPEVFTDAIRFARALESPIVRL